jgi:hypothetical protein
MARQFSHRRSAIEQPDAPLGVPAPIPAMGD